MAVQVRRCGDERNNSGSRTPFRRLPNRPSPEVDIVVIRIFRVSSEASVPKRFQDVLEEWGDSLDPIADHPAFPLPVWRLIGTALLAVVWWVSDDHGESL